MTGWHGGASDFKPRTKTQRFFNHPLAIRIDQEIAENMGGFRLKVDLVGCVTHIIKVTHLNDAVIGGRCAETDNVVLIMLNQVAAITVENLYNA